MEDHSCAAESFEGCIISPVCCSHVVVGCSGASGGHALPYLTLPCLALPCLLLPYIARGKEVASRAEGSKWPLRQRQRLFLTSGPFGARALPASRPLATQISA